MASKNALANRMAAMKQNASSVNTAYKETNVFNSPKEDILCNKNIKDLVPFKNHTFNVVENDDLLELSKSIKEHGLMVPVIIFQNEDNKFEIIAGHRRCRASELAGLTQVKCILKNVNRDQATIIMGETNLQSRKHITLIEKVKTYKIMYDAYKRQGKRTDLTSAQIEQKDAAQTLSEKANESVSAIRRYIKLYELEDNLLELANVNKFNLIAAYNIAYLSKPMQKCIYNIYLKHNVLPNTAQAQAIHSLYSSGELTEEKIRQVLIKDKTPKKMTFSLSTDTVKKYFPSMKKNEIEKKLIEILEFYEKNK